MDITRSSRRAAVGLLAAAGVAIATPAHASPEQLLPTTIEATFDEESFVEDVAVDRSGMVYASVPRSSRGLQGLYRLDHQGDITRLNDLAVGTLAYSRDGTLYGTVIAGDILDPGADLTFTLVRFDRAGRATTVATFPSGSQPNGIDSYGRYVYAADSGNGAIYRVDTRRGDVRTWFQDDRFRPADPTAGIPGSNGIQVFRDAVYVVNSSTGDFWRIPDAGRHGAGEPEILARGVTGDDFDIDLDGSAYVTTHPYNTLVRVRPDGSQSIVGDASTGIIGATAAAFGVRGGERRLFVVGDGGLFAKLVPPALLESFPATTREDFSAPFIAAVAVPRPGWAPQPRVDER
ncbi:MAG: SMP-30/gluconolactonase/LRE family protein [Dermatophilaceae bacterium]